MISGLAVHCIIPRTVILIRGLCEHIPGAHATRLTRWLQELHEYAFSARDELEASLRFTQVKAIQRLQVCGWGVDVVVTRSAVQQHYPLARGRCVPLLAWL
jgi:hypothetical protein